MVKLPAWAVRYLLQLAYNCSSGLSQDELDALATIELNMANQLQKELDEL